MGFVSDPATTRARIELLGDYFAQEVLGAEGVVCSSLDGCRRSALVDRLGRPRTGTEFAAGQLPHVGHHYDLTEDGRPLRILVIAMETGRADEQVTLDARRLQVARSAAFAMSARNPHMQGVTHALRLAVGRAPGADREGEMLELAGDAPVHLFDAYAMTNIRLCSAFATGTTDSRGTAVMSRNCLRHLTATLEVLEPTLCIVQGIEVAQALQSIVGRRTELAPHLARVELGGVDTLLVDLAHPTARPPLRWGALTGVPYLYETVVPTIAAARAAMSGTRSDEAPPPTPTARVAGVRRGFSLPPLRPDRDSPASTRVPGSGARNTHEVAADARAVVMREIGRRGGTARELRVGGRTELRVESEGTGTHEVRVISRRSGDFQTSIADGDAAGAPDNRFWVFVDLAHGRPRFFVAPEDWVVRGIRAEHDEYLARNGGRRARTDGSLHHRITTDRVMQWLERWDLLGLEPAGGAEDG